MLQNTLQKFPKIPENTQRFPKIPEDFRRRPKDVLIINQRIKEQFKRQLYSSEIIDILTSEDMENTPL